MTHDITLKFGSQYDGQGFKQLNKEMKEAGGGFRRVSQIFPEVAKHMDALDTKTATVAKGFLSLGSAVLTGGWWGIAVAGISALVGWMIKCVTAGKEVDAAVKKVGEEMEKVGKKAQQNAAFVQEFHDALELSKADKESAALNAVMKELDKYEELEQKIKDVTYAEEQRYDKFAKYNIAIQQAQVAVDKAQKNVEQAEFNARVYGGEANSWAVTNAMKELEFATIKLQAAENDKADAERKHKRTVEEREEAERKALEALEAENEARQAEFDRELEYAERRQALEGQQERDTEVYKARQAEIAKEIQGLQKQALEWEAQAQRARHKSFDEYYKSERRSDAQAERDARKEENWKRVAQEEYERLTARGTQANAGSNRADERRMAYLEEFLNAQDAANNPFEAAIQELKLEAASLEATFKSEMESIRQEISKFTMQ